MQLQPKKAVSAELATQKKEQIDEGKRIATIVDALRETRAKEEGSLERFRKEAVPAVQADIDRLLREKESLRDDIKILEKKRSEAQVPLDSEWDKVRQAGFKVEKDKQNVSEVSFTLKEREKEVERQEREIEVEKGRLQDLRQTTSENLAQSERSLDLAHKESSVLRSKAGTLLASAELRERLVEGRESEIDKVESSFAQREEKLQKYDQDLTNREKLLRDNYQTLERAKKEIYGRRGDRLK